MEPSNLRHIRVKTTLPRVPYPAHNTREPIFTERLVLRPMAPSDLDALRTLRTTDEIMAFTYQGRCDVTMAETEARLALYLPPHDRDTYNVAICDKETGRFLGVGGNLRRVSEQGWPEIGYQLLKEAWGKGYATEFLKAFLEVWWGLEREEAEVEAEVGTLPEGTQEGDVVPELMIGVALVTNVASIKVLNKSGFVKIGRWVNKKPVWDDFVLDDLVVLSCTRPDAGNTA